MTFIVYGSSMTVMMIVAFVLVVFSDRTSGQEYMGCFIDGDPRALPYYASSRVSGAKPCIDLCKARNEKFAGLQTSRHCFCGSDYSKYGRSDKCTMKCRDGGNCGGSWANTVYRVGPGPCHDQPCRNGATCSSNKMGYKCTCTPGFKGDNCSIDINECANNTGGCQHMCTNTEGSYQCSCFSGYQLVNGTRCTDINECATNTGGCQHMCNNTEGSYQCSCRSGYQLVYGQYCTDINECANNTGGCQHMCTNTEGSYQCSCFSGYQQRCTALPPTVGIPILIAAILTAVILTALIGVGTVVCYRRSRQVANLTVHQGSKRSTNNTYVDTANPVNPDNKEGTYETLNI